jgi:sulfur carrier protein
VSTRFKSLGIATLKIDVIPKGFSREEPAFLLETMTLTINGEDRDFPNITTLADLVSHLGMKPDRVAIELNRELIRRDRWPETQLSNGDKLGIVHFVGGGS